MRYFVQYEKPRSRKLDFYGADPKDPLVSPLLHKRIKDLPKTYIAVCTQDTLRDDGRLFKSALDDAGYAPSLTLFYKTFLISSSSVPNLYDEYTGYPHWFWAFPSEHLAEPIAKYNENLKKAFKFVLS
jgi:versiconal hemiacetal acetate esterase